MAHERDKWLDHGAAELLLRGLPVETADEHAQAQADRLARALGEAARLGYAIRSADESGETSTGAAGADVRAGGADVGAAELPGEAAALAAFRQAVRTAGRTSSWGRGADTGFAADAPYAGADGIGTVRLGPERRRVGLPSFGRPLRLGLAAAMAGCALSGVAAGAGYLYAPSAGESRPRPSDSISGVVTPEPLVSELPSGDVSPPSLPPDPSGSGTGSVTPGATGAHATTGTSGVPKNEGHKGDKGPASGNGWKGGGGGKWYAKLVQACHDYRNGTIAAGKKELLEKAAKGSAGVTHFCDELLSGGAGGGGHYEGGPGDDDGHGGGSTGGGDGGSTGGGDGGGDGGSTGGGDDGPQSGGPADGGTDGGPGEPPDGDHGETIGMNPGPDGANPPPRPPAVPRADAGTDADVGTGLPPGAGTDADANANADADPGTHEPAP